jgi:hypothetical protein
LSRSHFVQTACGTLLACLFAAFAFAAQAQNYLPSPDLAPGVIDPDATLEKVCGIPHYSRTVRPPTSYTNPIKAALMLELGTDDRSLFELDHRVPLCAGGHPRDPLNLWLEPRTGPWAAKFKDQLETSVCRELCKSGISLQEAQAIFLRPDWTVEYERFFGYR